MVRGLVRGFRSLLAVFWGAQTYFRHGWGISRQPSARWAPKTRRDGSIWRLIEDLLEIREIGRWGHPIWPNHWNSWKILKIHEKYDFSLKNCSVQIKFLNVSWCFPSSLETFATLWTVYCRWLVLMVDARLPGVGGDNCSSRNDGTDVPKSSKSTKIHEKYDFPTKIVIVQIEFHHLRFGIGDFSTKRCSDCNSIKLDLCKFRQNRHYSTLFFSKTNKTDNRIMISTKANSRTSESWNHTDDTSFATRNKKLKNKKRVWPPKT